MFGFLRNILKERRIGEVDETKKIAKLYDEDGSYIIGIPLNGGYVSGYTSKTVSIVRGDGKGTTVYGADGSYIRTHWH